MYDNTFPVELKYANEIKLRKQNKIIHKALRTVTEIKENNVN